ncbi:interleukin-10 receptor subunit beta-like [Seriola lalandi dorsalis]|uniref:Interleukin-10 receptor subunit beta-like n=1 Tax=Seriola lalandi dorsalis TaxID=1841481 RepID=A0A3B4WI91_SERLL|nr:interleukin-10 receptor subunit beta-like [Seriola lalandi dorsalis]
MSATIRTFILTFSTLCGSSVGSGILRTPTNVSLTSYNMDLVLRWSPPKGAVSSNLVYTVEYNTTVIPYTVGCVNISDCVCELSNLTRPIVEYGKYTGRVRAQLGSESSAWVESNHITPDKDTIVGSPGVTLLSNGATIEVSIKDPEFKVSALRNIYISATYNVSYWKDGQKEKAQHISDIQQNRVVLIDLDPETRYCVQVQINTESNPHPSKLSEVVCESTTTDEAPWMAAVLTFVLMAVAVALLVVGVVYRESISHLFCPKDALPQHFKEYLLTPPDPTIYQAMRNSHPPEEIYHQISVITDHRTVEEGGPLEVARTSCSKQADVSVGGVEDMISMDTEKQ